VITLKIIFIKVNFRQPNGAWSELWLVPRFWGHKFGGMYYHSVVLLALNYVSIIIATIFFVFITIKFKQAAKPNKIAVVKINL